MWGVDASVLADVLPFVEAHRSPELLDRSSSASSRPAFGAGGLRRVVGSPRMLVTMLAAAALIALLFGGGYLWLRGMLRDWDSRDHIAFAPAFAVMFFGAIAVIGVLTPWSFQLTATVGMTIWILGGAGLGWRARRGVVLELRRRWILVIPLLLGFTAVAAFGAVQGDPPHVVAGPGTLLSGRVTNLPPDHLFPVGVAQELQHGGDLERAHIAMWDLTDRTPLAGAVTAAVLSGVGTTLPAQIIWTLPNDRLTPQVRDGYGYWLAHLVLVFLNAAVIVAIGRLAWSIFGARAALIAGLIAAMNPYVFTHVFYTWPKMLAAYFVLSHWLLVRERRLPLLAGVFAGLAYLAHPLAGLFVLPTLVVSIIRNVRRGAAALAATAATVLPWQLWTTLDAHASRLLFYPLGYTIEHPRDLGHEFSIAWNRFIDAGIVHALRLRWDEILASVLPFNVARNFSTVPAGCDCISAASTWFTLHDRTVPGMVLYALCPFAVYGFVTWWRRAPWESVWMVAAPVGVALLFWGVASRGLGADLLQPLGAVLVVIAAGGLAGARRSWAVAGALLALVEAGTVLWWGLFARRDGIGVPNVALAVALAFVPCLLLVAACARVLDVDEATSHGPAHAASTA